MDSVTGDVPTGAGIPRNLCFSLIRGGSNRDGELPDIVAGGPVQGRCRHFEKVGAGTQTYQVMHCSETEGGRIPIGSICLLDREIVALDVAFRTRVPFQENIRSLCKNTGRQAEEAKNK